MHEPECRPQLEAVRDFFFAENAGQMADAYAVLTEASSHSLPAVDDWETVEFAFNRLFVGPMAPVAAPFGSLYLEPEPQVMGQSTLDARRIYEMLGVQSPLQGTLPDDHLSLELDACLRMSAICQASDSPDVPELRRYFLREHLAQWLPLWIDRVRTADQVPPSIDAVITILSDWLTSEISDLNSAEITMGHSRKGRKP